MVTAGTEVVAGAGVAVIVGVGVGVVIVAVDLVASAGGRGGGMAADDATVSEVAGAIVAGAVVVAVAGVAGVVGVGAVDLGDVAAFLDLPPPPILGLRRLVFFLGVGVANEVATNPTSTCKFLKAAT